MKQTVTQSMFIDSFITMGRKDQFSYDALCAIFDYLESLESDTGEEYELDPIGICCDFRESTIEDVISDFSLEFTGDEDEITEQAMDWLNDHTIVVSDNPLVYVQF